MEQKVPIPSYQEDDDEDPIYVDTFGKKTLRTINYDKNNSRAFVARPQDLIAKRVESQRWSHLRGMWGKRSVSENQDV